MLCERSCPASVCINRDLKKKKKKAKIFFVFEFYDKIFRHCSRTLYVIVIKDIYYIYI